MQNDLLRFFCSYHLLEFLFCPNRVVINPYNVIPRFDKVFGRLLFRPILILHGFGPKHHHTVRLQIKSHRHPAWDHKILIHLRCTDLLFKLSLFPLQETITSSQKHKCYQYDQDAPSIPFHPHITPPKTEYSENDFWGHVPINRNMSPIVCADPCFLFCEVFTFHVFSQFFHLFCRTLNRLSDLGAT